MQKSLLETQEYLDINGEEITYVLRRSKKRKKSISMRYNRQSQLQINAPYRMNQDVINDFIMAKYAWIKSQKEVVDNKNKIKTLTYENKEPHDFMGRKYSLCLIQSKSSQVFLKHDELLVFHRKNSSVKNILNRWYKNQALEYFTKRTRLLADQYNFPKIKTIKIRNMRARWGSCSSLSEITYNTHLIKVSLDCIDYVIIHELCHLIHPNHSPRFYQLQTQINPHWKAQKKLLNHFDLS